MTDEHEKLHDMYGPLDPATSQFRLVKSPQDSSQHMMMSFSLEEFSLYNSLPYTALSYAWTGREATCTIKLNEQMTYVRPNLYNYLQLMDDERHEGWMLIDALCINQADLDERSHQVRLMPNIYRRAAKVAAWLGADAPLPECSHPRDFIPDWLNLCDSEGRLLEKIARLSSADSQEIFLRNFAHALHRYEYWSRLWIVPEIILARVFEVRVKKIRLQGEEFERLCRPFWSSREEKTRLLMPAAKQADGAAYISVEVIMTQRRRVQDVASSPHMTLSRAVRAFAHQDCTETFDKVFGLLGLTECQMYVDYRMPRLELFARVMIEGTLELRSPVGSKQNVRNNSTVGEEMVAIHPFAAVALFVLDLHPRHPAVLVSIFLMLTLLYPGSRRIWEQHKMITEWFELHVKGSGPLETSGLIVPKSRLKGGLSELRSYTKEYVQDLSRDLEVKRWKRRNALIPAYEDNEEEVRYNVWAAWTENIFANVKERMGARKVSSA